jgi:hypothetical protein
LGLLRNDDIVYCSSDDCINETCERNQNFNMDWSIYTGNFAQTIVESDFWKDCPEYLPLQVDDYATYDDDMEPYDD